MNFEACAIKQFEEKTDKKEIEKNVPNLIYILIDVGMEGQ